MSVTGDVDGAGGRRWRLLMGMSYAAIAIVIAAIGLVVTVILLALLLLRGVSPGADASKARAEVQRYYDMHVPGLVDVRACAYTPVGDSDFDVWMYSVCAPIAAMRSMSAVVNFGVPWLKASDQSYTSTHVPRPL